MKLSAGVHSIYSTFIFIGLVLGLQACGGSSTPPPPADANPVGYYAGTLSTTTPSQIDISAKAISDSDKFMLVHIDNSATQNTILYVGTFTDITATTFTADVRIYLNGVFLRTATITNGSITEKSSMSGTLSGTGDYTSTSFSLSYDTTINARTPLDPATNEAANEVWLEPITAAAGGQNQTGFTFDAPNELVTVFGNHAMVVVGWQLCTDAAINLTNVNSEQPGRIRKYSVVSPTCGFPSVTGYITSFDSSGADDRYLWISYNTDNSFAAELVKQ